MLHKRKTANINGKNPWFPQGCKSQCSHILKTANIKSCYDPRSRLWYYKAYNRAFCGPTTHKCSYKRAYLVIIFVYQLSYSLYMYSAH
jgi:hypothetical protein